jgi:FixJ family two-component response regulator
MIDDSAIVHVVDDDACWRESVGRLLSAVGYRIALYGSAEAFLEECRFDAPGCILLDLQMSGLSGLQLQRRLAEVRHVLPIIFISGHGDIPSSVLAMRAGADDFLTKPVASEILFDAVERAIARNRDARVKQEQLRALRDRISTLTPTERRVMDLVIVGKLNKQIGVDLGTAERTVKWHRHNLMQKLQIQSLAELVSIAERVGLATGSKRSKLE